MEGRCVTAHTFLQLREHLKLRGIHLTINFKAEEFLSHGVAVCEICYAITIAEYHLMNAERKFARIQGIPVKEQNVPIDAGKSRAKVLAERIARPVLPTTLLYQWRILFYFRSIIDIEGVLITSKNYYIQFKLFEHITKFPFTYNVNEGSINKLRVHYFFSITKGLDGALKDLMVDIRITETESWERLILVGKSMSLSEFVVRYSPLETTLIAKAVSLFTLNMTKHVTLKVLL
jgi:hypothetical protein